MAQTLSSAEINRMKADAVRRTKQMYSRAERYTCPPQSNEGKKEEEKAKEVLPKGGSKSLSSYLGINLENEQLIIFVLIILLAKDKENYPLLLALLYIAM